MTTERFIIWAPLALVVLALVVTVTYGWLTAVTVVGSYLLVSLAAIGLLFLFVRSGEDRHPRRSAG
jgi:amino acid transporter